MEQKKYYAIISLITGLILLYGLGSYIYYFFANSYYNIFNLLVYLPSMLGITGIIIFYSSGFKRSALFRFYMCFEIFSFPFSAWFFISYFMRDAGPYTESRLNISLFVGIFLTLLLTACCTAGLWLLSRAKGPKITYVEHGGETAGQFEPANGGLRFANRIIDTSVLLFIIFRQITSSSFFLGDIRVNNYLAYTLIEIPAIFIYYLLLEGIFNTSAGKCATNTTIVNEYGNRPSFAQILGRTFCRLIPFDALSFLGAGARGWHDSLSNTYVVEAANPDEMNEITLDAELNQQDI